MHTIALLEAWEFWFSLNFGPTLPLLEKYCSQWGGIAPEVEFSQDLYEIWWPISYQKLKIPNLFGIYSVWFPFKKIVPSIFFEYSNVTIIFNTTSKIIPPPILLNCSCPPILLIFSLVKFFCSFWCYFT